jgi:hypothetical protein
VDDLTWGALALTLTVLGGIWTWLAFRRRGVASGLRALAFTLLPLAAYLTRTLRMFSQIAQAVTDWATHLVLDPAVWIGIVLAGLSVALFAVSRLVRRRTRPARQEPERAPRATGRKTTSGELPASRGRGEPAIDDDMADIEALLRRHGIE